MENCSVAMVKHAETDSKRAENESKLTDWVISTTPHKTSSAAVANNAESHPAAIIESQRAAGNWVGLTSMGRVHLYEEEPVLIRNSGGSTTNFDGYSGVAKGNLKGKRPTIELRKDKAGDPILPPESKSLDKKCIFVLEE